MAEILSNVTWILCIVLVGLSAGWSTLAILYIKASALIPSTEKSHKHVSTWATTKSPYFVSVIVPARNEETYIKRCLLSLLSQRYHSFEIIMIDDSSTDNTASVAKTIKDARFRLIQLKKTPAGWSGKSWASHVGYLASNGQILLFTDADSCYYNKYTIANTIALMLKEQVNVVTGSPLIELRDFYSKLVMPLFNLFSVFRTLSSVVQGDQDKSRSLIGGFFLISKSVLDKVGGFSCVRTSIQEDSDLGEQIMNAGYSIKLIKVNNLVSALWSRNQVTLLEGIKRIISYNLTNNSNMNIVVDITTIFFMVIVPFLLLPFAVQLYENNENNNVLPLIILSWNLSMCLIPLFAVSVKGMRKHRLNPVYSTLILFAASFFLTVYLVSLVHLMSFPFSRAISWKGRKYV
jgi:glycosyltransferase involved in cell wall biosynthesis